MVGVTVMRLALTGVVGAGPVDFSSAVAPSQPAAASAASAPSTTAILAGESPGRAACAGRPALGPVTVWREGTRSVCPSTLRR